MLDQLPDGKVQEDSGTDHVMLVSLGCFCGPKLSFKHIGRGAASLPFDWMRTRSCGLLHFLRHDFDGFFDYFTKKPVPGCNMTTYRGYYHSFWHDDPTDPGMLERYKRRIKRFDEISASEQPVLFARCIASTDEISELPELLEALMSRHGKLACLLAIIDFQMTAKGAAIVEGYPNLLVYYLNGEAHVGPDGEPAPPYSNPVLCALEWVVGRPIQAMKFSNMEKIAECADETHWGLQGLGGLNAFEASPEGPPELESDVPSPHGVSSAAAPARPPALSSDLLEAEEQAIERESEVVLVSLGCSPATKRTLQQMGLGREALPFDWVRVSFEGLLHFLRKGFAAPVRENLGAGGQRPSERHGFFDAATRKRVPGTELTMFRSHLHSFWHDDIANPEVREKYESRFLQFDSIHCSGKPVLFVHAVATTTELPRADELLSVLSRRYGEQAVLLLIVDFQTSHPGTYVVDGYDDLLVYFLEGSAHEGGDAAAPYRAPIECALGWLRGDPLEAASVPDLRTLHGLADETSWGLTGLGGLSAFEPLPSKTEDPDVPQQPAPAEEAWVESARAEVAKESIALVSLGCDASTAKALQMLQFADEESPFDVVRTRLEGVLHFVRDGFGDFFDVTHCEAVPGTRLTARRSFYHSFWEEGPIDQPAHRRRMERFDQLATSERTKLFVRSVATSEELGRLGELLEQLQRRFRGYACLLALVPGQPSAKLLSVEGNYNILVQFLAGDAAGFADASAYCEPIRQSLDWAVGRAVKAAVVANFEELRCLAVPVSTGLVGLGGLPAFEDVAPVGTAEGDVRSPEGKFCPVSPVAERSPLAGGA